MATAVRFHVWTDNEIAEASRDLSASCLWGEMEMGGGGGCFGARMVPFFAWVGGGKCKQDEKAFGYSRTTEVSKQMQ